jgi:aminopeptidase N
MEPNYGVEQIHLFFDLQEAYTEVTSTAEYFRLSTSNELVLDGEGLELIEVAIDGQRLTDEEYLLTDQSELKLVNLKERFTLKVVTRIYPHLNKSNRGLYLSSGIFSTQCEPVGFRTMTYFQDRPDVMTRFTVTIEADKEKYPQLLSNGNLESQKDLPDGRHQAIWVDPSLKPSYLFALVAADLGKVTGSYTTLSGKSVAIEVYVDKGNEYRAQHALQSLIDSMRWDEERYGLEYDLDVYMIVSVDSFNMGAMENKVLNIFNSVLTLADPKSATDQDYFNVQATVGHEYFHNWTGNRVTCRDWFQLTLKEGLTVYRDQEFSSDMNDRDVVRIDAVKVVRSAQFPEDSGPMAHPIRPDSFVEIDNFYTTTVYRKGGEVVRMVETLIGRDKFRLGMDKYFELYDGQAVTCDDFIFAMQEASGYDFTQFKNWYSQAGTPVVEVEERYDANSEIYSLTFSQHTPGFPNHQTFVIPIKLGLISANGDNFVSETVELKELTQTFSFTCPAGKPTPSLLRGFSAPVKLEFAYSQDDLIFLMANDEDGFNRYEAAQRLAMVCIKEVIRKNRAKEQFRLRPEVIDAYRKVLLNSELAPAIRAKVLAMPTVAEIAEDMKIADFNMAFKAREFVIKSIAVGLEFELVLIYDQLKDLDGLDKSGERSLKNCCLSYLSELGDFYKNVIVAQYKNSTNMTDTLVAMQLLNDMARCCQSQSDHADSDEREEIMADFYEKWKTDTVVMNKWFRVYASSIGNGVLERVKNFINLDAFDETNSNKVYASYRAFCGNLVHFHQISGDGYRFIADKVIKIDGYNSSVAATLARGFSQLAKLDPMRQALMKHELKRILLASPSDQVKEIVESILK